MARFLLGERPVTLGYSANVRPAQSLDQVCTHLRTISAGVRDGVAPGRPYGVCLYFGGGALRELEADPSGVARLRDELAAGDFFVYAVNAFPLGNFHAPVVKEGAYRPDWTTPERRAMTEQIARLVCELAPEGSEIAVSTVAGGYKPDSDDAAQQRMAEQLVATAQTCWRLGDETGRNVVLCLEPEPWTTCETVADAVRFFTGPVAAAAEAASAPRVVAENLGVNLDLCHAAVEHEDPLAAAQELQRRGIRIGSVHASAALCVPGLSEANLQRLRAFEEARYLHQVVASAGGLPQARWRDLPDLFAGGLPEGVEADELRVHFHVPLDAPDVEGFPTSAAATADAVRDVVAAGYTDKIIAETYTWGVGALSDPGDLAERLAGELRWLIDRLPLTAAPQ
jgi:hypothetical protein